MDEHSQAKLHRPKSGSSVRCLMALVLILGGGFGWFARFANRVAVQREAVAAIRGAGQEAWYAPEYSPFEYAPNGENFRVVPDATSTLIKELADSIGPDSIHQVKSVRIHGPTVKAAMAALENLDRLEDLSLSGPEVNDDTLEHIRELTNLRSLNLFNTEATGAGLVHLRKLTGLKRISMSEVAVSDAELGYLRDLTALESLSFDASRISDAGAAHLRGMVHMKRLGLNNSRITSVGLAHFGGMTGLTHLMIDGTQVNRVAAQ